MRFRAIVHAKKGWKAFFGLVPGPRPFPRGRRGRPEISRVSAQSTRYKDAAEGATYETRSMEISLLTQLLAVYPCWSSELGSLSIDRLPEYGVAFSRIAIYAGKIIPQIDPW